MGVTEIRWFTIGTPYLADKCCAVCTKSLPMRVILL